MLLFENRSRNMIPDSGHFEQITTNNARSRDSISKDLFATHCNDFNKFSVCTALVFAKSEVTVFSYE